MIRSAFAFSILPFFIGVGVVFFSEREAQPSQHPARCFRFTQIAKPRTSFAVAGPVLRISIELREHDDRDVQLLREAFEAEEISEISICRLSCPRRLVDRSKL
jgi:hypothetical protein